eukprot:389465_1
MFLNILNTPQAKWMMIDVKKLCHEAYGRLINPNIKATYQWKVRIINVSDWNQIKIGIVCGKVPYRNDLSRTTKYRYYAYCQDGQKYSHKWKNGMPYIGSFDSGDV